MENPIMLPEEFLRGINNLSIDASSIIYLLKIGILGSVSAEINLITSKQIIDEVGWPHLPIISYYVDPELTNDETVVEIAREKNISVLSEDREVLKNAESKGLDYYNSLMILNYLFFKERILSHEYPDYLNRLIEVAHYSEDVLEYGNEIKKLIDKRLEIGMGNKWHKTDGN